MQPLRLPSAETEAVYAAYRAWTAIVARPEFALGLRLAPGDCLVFDNTRILHARTAFAPGSGSDASPGSAALPGAAALPGSAALPGVAASAGSGERHLQGGYADLDGLLSALAVLRRAEPPTLKG